jgi:blocked early in transport 1
METTDSLLGGTLRQLGGLMDRGGGSHMCMLVVFVVVLFLVLYFLILRR